MFDDCKGEKMQDLLAAFSTLVLRKVLAEGQDRQASIAGRLASANRLSVEEHKSFLPLAIAHRASLTALLRRKRDLRVRYEGFGKILDVKEQELDQRFEAVVKTQEFLDDNPIPDHTVSRVSKLFEKNWKGDARLVETVARGEEGSLKDSLLDEPFSKVWPKISEGTFNGSTQLASQGLLADLEKRVAGQEARLNQWKKFKEAMKADIKPLAGQNVQSPTLIRVKSNNSDLQRQRDLVFSPRKSPRKSEWGVQIDENRSSPTPSIPKSTIKIRSIGPSTSLKEKYTVDGEARNQWDESETKREGPDFVLRSSSIDDGNHSGFSEISEGNLHYGDPSENAGHTENPDSSTPYAQSQPSAKIRSTNSHARADCERSHTTDSPEKAVEVDPDDLLADQIISMTLNAGPTPAKPKLSLVERTRQSIIASSSPSKLQPTTAENSAPPHPPLPILTEHQTSNIPHSHPATLLERTRQSISLVPTQPRPPRQSTMHGRRTSKIYPTNQFETPKKQMQKGKGFTPPEELFTPGAGYDSVFKSRPKVGFSPVASPKLGVSPVEDDVQDLGSVDERRDAKVREDSPLGRVGATV